MSNNAATKFTRKSSGKKRLRGRLHRAVMVLVAFVAVLCTASTLAYADSNPLESGFSPTVNTTRNKQYSAAGVYQGTDGTTFGSPMHVSTIYIDMAKLNGLPNRMAAEFKSLTTEPGIYLDEATNMAMYKPTETGATQLYGMTDNYFEGDLFSFTYKDAAILSNGARANVRITYSNAHIALDRRYGATDTFQDEVYLAQAGKVQSGNTNNDGSYNVTWTDENGRTYQARNEKQTGVIMDARIQIVDNNGDPVEGTFILPMTGININRVGSGSGVRATSLIYGTENYDYYSESIRVNSGNTSNIYVRSSADYYTPIRQETSGVYQGAVRFVANDGTVSSSGTGQNTGVNNNYNSGFVTTADAAKGISMTSYAGGIKGLLFETFYMDGDEIWHRITISSGSGGNVATTIEGNASGKLDDGSGILQPPNPYETYTTAIPDGKTVVYTATPQNGYSLGNLSISGFNKDGSLIPGSEIIIDATGATADNPTVDINDADGNKIGEIEYHDAGGSVYYTITFTQNMDNHKVHVTWTPLYAFYKTWAGAEPGNNDTATFTATPYTFDTAQNKFVQSTSIAPVDFTVKKNQANVTKAGNLTTWKFEYPASGKDQTGDGDINDNEDWKPLPFENPIPHEHDNGVTTYTLEEIHWFIKEKSSTGTWMFGSYDNSDAVVADTLKGFQKAQELVRADNTKAYLSIFDESKPENAIQGGRVSNVEPVIIKATKTWNDLNNEFDTREDVVFHLDVRMEDHQRGETLGGKLVQTTDKSLVGVDVLPPYLISKSADSEQDRTVVWGTQVAYTGHDGSHAHANLANALAEINGQPYDNSFISHMYIVGEGNSATAYYVNCLPGYDVDGGKFNYVIRETDLAGTEISATPYNTDPAQALVGYTTAFDEKNPDAQDEFEKRYVESTNSDGVKERAYGITNTLETTSLTVNKKWVDNATTAHTAEQLLNNFHLYRVVGSDAATDVTNSYVEGRGTDGVASKTDAAGQAYVTVSQNADGTWSYAVEGLPAYAMSENGVVQQASYYITEDPIAGYGTPHYANAITLAESVATATAAAQAAGQVPTNTLADVRQAVDNAVNALIQQKTGIKDRALDGGTIANVVLPTGSTQVNIVKQLVGSTTLAELNKDFTFKVYGTNENGAYITTPLAQATANKNTDQLTVITQMGTHSEVDLGTIELKTQVDTVADSSGATTQKVAVYAKDINGAFNRLGYLEGGTGTSAGSFIATLEVREDPIAGVAGLVQASNTTLGLTVTDDGNGHLTATIDNERPVAVNTHTASTNATVDLTKILEGRVLRSDDFSFTAEYEPDLSATGLSKEEFDKLRVLDPEIVDAVKRGTDLDIALVNALVTNPNNTDLIDATLALYGSLATNEPDYEALRTELTKTSVGDFVAAIRAGGPSPLTNGLTDIIRDFSNEQIAQAAAVGVDAKAFIRGCSPEQYQALQMQLRLIQGMGGTTTRTIDALTVDNTHHTGKSNALNLTFTKAGTYKFKIFENVPEDATQNADGTYTKNGITYDNDVENVTITVVANADGTLTATADPTGVTFNNSYAAEGKADVQVSKTITGRNWMVGDSFSFTIEKDETRQTANATPDGGSGNNQAPLPANTTATANVAAGDDLTANVLNAAFESITYRQSDLKKVHTADDSDHRTYAYDDFYYKVTEVVPNDATENKKDGVTYDTTPHYVHVRVADVGDGKLEATVYNYDNGTDTPVAPGAGAVTFANAYTSTGTAIVAINKDIAGRAWTAGESIEFSLVPGSSTVPVPQKDANALYATATASDTSHTATFGQITFNQEHASYEVGATRDLYYEVFESIPAEATNDATGRTYSVDLNGVGGDVAKLASYGTYTYTNNATGAKTQYSTKALDVKITLVDDGKGNISAAVSYPDGNTVTNPATIIPSIALSGNKLMVGRALESGRYSFELVNGKNDQFANAAETRTENETYKGTFTLKPLFFSSGDTLDNADGTSAAKALPTGTYYLREIVPNNALLLDADGNVTSTTYQSEKEKKATENAAGREYIISGYYVSPENNSVGQPGRGIIYDGFERAVNISISDTGAIEAKYRDQTIVELLNNGPVFTNRYKADGNAQVRVRKMVAGAAWEDEMQWDFSLTKQGNAPAPTQADQVVKGTDASKYATWSIPFTQDDIGKTYTYSVREQEPNYTGYDSSKWESDTEDHAVTVKVNDGGNGVLSFEITYAGRGGTTTSELDIVNKMLGGGANILAKKEVVGPEAGYTDYWPDNASFQLKLEAVGGTRYDSAGQSSQSISAGEVPMPAKDSAGNNYNGDVQLEATKGEPDINFGVITYDNVTANWADGDTGLFVYRIVEVEPGSTLSYITYDQTPKYAYVHVTKAANDGALSTIVTYGTSETYDESTATNTIPTFTNQYNATSVIVPLIAQKVLTGREWKNDDSFEFKLSMGTTGKQLDSGRDGSEDATISPLALEDGMKQYYTDYDQDSELAHGVNFGTVTFSLADLGAAHEKEFDFSVSETQGAIPGITYSSASHALKVKVTDDRQGNLTATVVNGNGQPAAPVISNSYMPTKATVELKANKIMTGRELIGGHYTYQLYEGDFGTEASLDSSKLIRESSVPADGIVTLVDPTAREAGENGANKEYKYTIVEKIPDANNRSAGVTYDESRIVATVIVSDADHDGSAQVQSTTYQKYVKSGDAWTAEGSAGTTELALTNTYRASGERALQVNKTLTGRAWKQDETVNFTLTPENSAPIHVKGEGNTVTDGSSLTATATANGTTTFANNLYFTQDDLKEINGDAVIYHESREFVYKIVEDAPNGADTNRKFEGTTYDGATYYAVVTVSDHNRNGQLTTSVTYRKDSSTGTAVTLPTFINEYKSQGEGSVNAKKVLNGDSLNAYQTKNGTFTFTLRDASGNVVKDKAGNELNNIAADVNDGTITFTGIPYTQADMNGASTATKRYYLTENIPQGAQGNKKDGVTYDTATYVATLTLTDDGKGNITATQNTSVKDLTVTNVYDASGTITADLGKVLEGRLIVRGGFSFKLEGQKVTHENGSTTPTFSALGEGETVPMPANTTATVTAATNNQFQNWGTTEFGTINLTMENLKNANGTYAESKEFGYKVTEIIPVEGSDNPGIRGRYDTTEFYAVVTMSNEDHNGDLDKSVKYYKKVGDSLQEITAVNETTSRRFTFINNYQANGTATITPIKQIIGRNWVDISGLGTQVAPFEFQVVPYSSDTVKSKLGDGTVVATVPLPGNTIDPTARTSTNSNNDQATTTANTNLSAGSGMRQAPFENITFTEKMLAPDSTDGVLKGDFFYEITETGTYAGFNNGQPNSQKFYAQVHVDDNRVGGLNTRIYYYDNASNVGDINKAMPTAPIFQNEYKASSNAAINVAKHIEGRTWKSDDAFDFTLSIQGPGPMPTGTDADKLTIRYSNTTSPAEDNIDRTGSYTFNVPLDALTNTTTATSNLKYSDGTTSVPAGVKYNTFTYRLDEQANGVTDLNYQTAPVYVKIVAIDKLDGTIDLNTTYHTAMPCTDANKINANIATFTNTYFHDLKIPVKKTVFGNSAPEQEYTFTLTDSEGAVRSTKTVTADANGKKIKSPSSIP